MSGKDRRERRTAKGLNRRSQARKTDLPEHRCDRCDAWFESAAQRPSLCPRCKDKGMLNAYSKEELWHQIAELKKDAARAKEANGTAQVVEVHRALDTWPVPHATAKAGGRAPKRLNAAERVENFLEILRHPANRTAYACVQMFEALRRQRQHLQCSCNALRSEHKPECVCWRADSLINACEHDFFPEDAAILRRVFDLILTASRFTAPATAGFYGVPRREFDELVEIAEGHPVAVSDLHAKLESLRISVERMKARAGLSKIVIAGQHNPQFEIGYKKCAREFLAEIDPIARGVQSDICAELIVAFAAWLTTRPKTFRVGARENSATMAGLADRFIKMQHLRRERQG